MRTNDLEKACRELLEKAKLEGVSIETLQALLGSLNAH
jgi:hypothetical protein